LKEVIKRYKEKSKTAKINLKKKGKDMIKKITIAMMLLVFMIGAISSVQAAKEVTIEGMVENHSEDESGNITQIAVGVYNTEIEDVEYHYIEKKGKGAELFKHVGENVKVTGTVSKDKDGNKLVSVSKYEIVKEEWQDTPSESEE
jgi:hypothetical protein